jgi:hypothetical protein
MSLDEVRAMLGTQVPKYERYTDEQLKIIAKFQQPSNNPDAFDARTKWPTCVHPIRDQVCV